MGYTHYWRQKDVPTPEEWKELTDLVKQMCSAAILLKGLPIQYEADTAEPLEITEERIRFNGIGQDGHETFYFARNAQDFEFCKTRLKPYDDWVTAVLMLVNHLMPGHYEISSDGGQDDWIAGQRLVKQHLGLDVDIPKEIPLAMPF